MKKDKKEHKEEKKDTKEAENELSLVEEKTKLAEDYLDQLQRVQADFENYRKRMVKEKEDFRKYVLEDVLYELLAVIDNIQRAVEASKQNHGYLQLFEQSLSCLHSADQPHFVLLQVQLTISRIFLLFLILLPY